MPAQTAVEAARQALLAWLDAQIDKAPVQYQAGLRFARGLIATSSALPADLVGTVLDSIKTAILSGDFGKATGSDSDLA